MMILHWIELIITIHIHAEIVLQLAKHVKLRNFHSFYDEKCLERFSKERPQVYLIDDGNKKVFYKLKHNIVGGPSLVFCRYHEANKTHIHRYEFNDLNNRFKLLKKKKIG